MPNDRLRIVTLLARHGTAKYADALPDIQSLFLRQMPEVAHDIVVADNAEPVGREEELEPGVTLIGASNAAWEFSAWDSAVARLGDRLDGYDFVHLATSAFRQLYTRYLDRFDERMLRAVRGRAVAVGHVDCYNAPVSLLGFGCQAWLRSSFIFLAPAELRLLGSLAGATDGTRFFSGDPEAPFREDAPISPGYRQNILGWLTGDGTGQGTEWHSRFRLGPDTLAFFESKTLAILNEQMLSSRLRGQGCAMVDATWLATQVGAGRGQPLGALPDWRHQITSRDVNAAPAEGLLD